MTRLPVRSAAALAAAAAAVAVPGAARPTATPDLRPAAAIDVPSYWEVASDGGIFAFGGVPFYGSMGGQHLNAPIVGMAATADQKGYWEVASDGGIFSFGDATFHGSMGGTPLAAPVVGVAADPATGGYWEVGADGGVFAFDAPSLGSEGGRHLAAPVVGIAATRDGRGYWLVGANGAVYAFGDATDDGSMAGSRLAAPVVGIAPTADGGGYWLVGADGGVFAFGDAAFEGSMGGQHLNAPIVGMAASPAGGGYWQAAADGGIFAFGSAGFWGSMGGQPLNAPVVGIAEGPGDGVVTRGSVSPTPAPPSPAPAPAPAPTGWTDVYPSGSYGYDISKYQDNASCTGALPQAASIGIVEVTGASLAAPNPCLAHEAAWAGWGINLYIFLTYGVSGVNEPGCYDNTACNYGYQAAQYAWNYAVSQHIATDVGWWLDVEPGGGWSSNTTLNGWLIAGAAAGIRAEGDSQVGIYTSVLTWAGIAGSYAPDLPVWAAWYTGDPQANCANAMSYAAAHGDDLPTGGVRITQYTDNNGTLDGDYAC